MRQQVASILQIGIAFTAVVMFLDVLLNEYPALNWLALTVLFSLVAAIILDLLARGIPTEKRPLRPPPQRERDLDYLEGIVENAISRHDERSCRVLYEKLRSIALGTVAAKTRRTKKEILELAQMDTKALLGLVEDSAILGLIVGNASAMRYDGHQRVEELLSRIEAWPR